MSPRYSALPMMRLSLLIVVYALLVFTTHGNTVLKAEREYQHIEKISQDSTDQRNAYVLTNEGSEPAIYTLGLYVRADERVSFPYRLVYQDGSQTLAAGESVIVYPEQFAAISSEYPDTLVVNSTGTLSVASVERTGSATAAIATWMPYRMTVFTSKAKSP